MDRKLNYDRTTMTIKPETLAVKTVDITPFKFTLSDADIAAYEKLGDLMRDIARTGGEAMARVVGNSYPGNFGVGTDEACCMVSRVSSKPTKAINKDWNKFLLEMIEATITQEPHLGDNLKRQCLDYLNEIREREMKEGRL